MKSLTRSSLACEKLPGRETGGSARPAAGTIAATAATSSAVAAAMLLRRAPSVLQGLIDHLLDCRLDLLPLRRRLLEQHEEHVLFAVDYEIAAAGAIPFQFAERT